MPFDIIYNVMFQTQKHNLFDGFNYFRNMKSFFSSLGFSIEYARVPFSDSVISRSEALRKVIEETLKKYNSDKVHLICHRLFIYFFKIFPKLKLRSSFPPIFLFFIFFTLFLRYYLVWVV
jgi:hypothetical protein